MATLTINASALPLVDPEEMMAKGTFGWIMLATADVDSSFDHVVEGGAEVVQEPTDQPWGTRDCAVRDPAGNMIRIQEVH